MPTTTARRPGRLTSSIAGSVVALALLAGCGGAGGGPGPSLEARSPFQIAFDAPGRTLAAGTSRIAMDVRMSSTGGLASQLGGGFDTPMVMTGEGTYDYERQIGQAEMTVEGGGLPASTSEVVFAENVSYERPVGTTRWVKLDVSAMVNRPVGQYDPADQLGLLRGVSDADVRDLGTAEVRGEQVRHLGLTIDPAKLAAETDVVVEGGLTQSALRSVNPMPADVFVDDDGRVRRMEIRLTVEGANIDIPGLTDDPAVAQRLQQVRSESTIAIDYFDFGVPVTAEVPDPSQVDSGPAFPVPGPR